MLFSHKLLYNLKNFHPLVAMKKTCRFKAFLLHWLHFSDPEATVHPSLTLSVIQLQWRVYTQTARASPQYD